MKRMKWMAIVALFTTLLFLTAGVAAAQSLGDYARAVRKQKPEPATASHHYDNDNLPTGDALSVVGPPPTNNADAGAVPAAAAAPTASDSDKQKAADDWNQKLQDEREKVDALSHELDLDQREMRLRVAAAYTDPSVSVRNVEWNKDDARYKSEIEEKQKGLDDAKKELDNLQDQGHKAGYTEVAPSAGNDSSKDNNDSDQKKDQGK